MFIIVIIIIIIIIIITIMIICFLGEASLYISPKDCSKVRHSRPGIGRWHI